MNFETTFVNPQGRASRSQFVPALITVLAVALFYAFIVTGRNATWCVVFLLYPGFVLHARRLHDMGHNAWLLLVPVALMLVAFAIWLKLVSLGAQLDGIVPKVALGVAAAFALWGCIGKGQSEANTYGAPATS
jgi:uncharacterized membrane protein YhaH (DUF805 family)